MSVVERIFETNRSSSPKETRVLWYFSVLFTRLPTEPYIFLEYRTEKGENTPNNEKDVQTYEFRACANPQNEVVSQTIVIIKKYGFCIFFLAVSPISSKKLY